MVPARLSIAGFSVALAVTTPPETLTVHQSTDDVACNSRLVVISMLPVPPGDLKYKSAFVTSNVSGAVYA